MTKKINEPKWRAWLISQLRRVHYSWEERSRARKRAWVRKGIYRCNLCKGEFDGKSIQVDHIEPVVNPAIGFYSWTDYVERLFSNVDNYQILCKPCHAEKTAAENSGRVEGRRVRREKAKKEDD